MREISAAPSWEPETRYARSGDVHIAYQTWGSGEVTMVGVPGIINNIELWWQEPESRRYFLALGSFSRFVFYDKRGRDYLTAIQLSQRLTSAWRTWLQ